MKAENLFLLLIFVFTAIFMGVGWTYGRKASLVPWVIGSLILVLTSCAGVKNVLDASVPRLKWKQVFQEAERHLLIVGGAVFACVVILVAGFVAMAFLFPWLYITVRTGRWLLGFLVGAGLGGIIYWLGYFLAIPFPEPMLLDWLKF